VRVTSEERLDRLKKAVRAFARERDWEQFHTPKNLAMAMSVEASEVVEIFQWLTPEQADNLSAKQREHLEEELGDTFIYLLKLAEHFGLDLVDAGARKLEKTKLKYPVDKSRGRMTKYTDL
jgi:NTP pyrophosphatase (non-canonical NTP hydrolase)